LNCNVRSDGPTARKCRLGRVGLCQLVDQDPAFGLFWSADGIFSSLTQLLSVACVGTGSEDVVRARYYQGGRSETNRRMTSVSNRTQMPSSFLVDAMVSYLDDQVQFNSV